MTNQSLVYVICFVSLRCFIFLFLNLTHAFFVYFILCFRGLFIVWVWLWRRNVATAACWRCVSTAHSPYGLAAYANVNGLDPAGGSGGGGSGQLSGVVYHHQDDHEQQEFGLMNPAGHSPNRRMAPPPPSRSSESTYQPRPPPPVPAEAMASLNIGLDKSGPFVFACLAFILFFYLFSLIILLHLHRYQY